MTTKKVALNVWRNAHAVVTAVQGEIAARFIEVALYDRDTPLDITGKTAAIYLTKPDKTIVYNQCEILDGANGVISVELTSQMSAVAGTICDCEIHIIDPAGSLLKITGLTIVIDRSVEDGKAVESSNEFTLLLRALEQADGIWETVTETLEEKLAAFEDSFQEQAVQMAGEMAQWLAEKDEELLHKMQSVDDWLGSGEEQLQQVVTAAQSAVQAAVEEADSAEDRASQAVEEMEQVAGALVDDAIALQKNQPNGVAGLDAGGKLQQMPTAADTGAVPVSRTVNGKALTGDITLTAADINAIAQAEKNQPNGVAGLDASGKLQQMPPAADTGAAPDSRTANAEALTGDITLTAADVSAVAQTEKNQPNGVAGLDASGKLQQMPTAADTGAVPVSRTVNGKALTGDITLTAEDIGSKALFLAAHPVGSLFFTTASTNPSTLYGGTWAAWGGGRTPVGVNAADASFNGVEKSGGAKTHTLTIDEMPSHTHDLSMRNGSVVNDYYGDPQGGTGADATYRASAYLAHTGGGQAHNNLQPYLTCYIWKRTT